MNYLLKSKIPYIFSFLFFFGLLTSCCKEEKPYALNLPAGFPMPEIPEDNQLTQNRIELGKKLFFDPILSRDSTISCASCHLPEKAFTDGLTKSRGIAGRTTLRNSPSLFNVAYRDRFFYDGGVPSLELQVAAPIEAHEEMDFNLLEVVKRLEAHSEYPKLIKKAYQRDPDIFSYTRAIAAYERTLISGNSRYDQFYYGADKAALNADEKKGMELFFSDRTQCGTCHAGFNFTNEQYENIGLYLDYSDDPGRRRVTGLPEDIGKFKVPSLRNVSLTAPYMHDGSLASLEEVIDFFDSGGLGHPNKSSLIQPLQLSAQEKQQLIAFLESLTGESLLR